MATSWEIEHGAGEHWWLSILRAFTGGKQGDDSAAGKPKVDPQNVRWM